MLTQWGERLDPSAALTEYPRPQFRRESCINLNGLWDYAITPKRRRARSSTTGRYSSHFQSNPHCPA